MKDTKNLTHHKYLCAYLQFYLRKIAPFLFCFGLPHRQGCMQKMQLCKRKRKASSHKNNNSPTDSSFISIIFIYKLAVILHLTKEHQ